MQSAPDNVDQDVHSTLVWTQVGVGVMVLTLIVSVAIAYYIRRASKAAEEAQNDFNIANRLSTLRRDLKFESDPDVLNALIKEGYRYTAPGTLAREQLERLYYG